MSGNEHDGSNIEPVAKRLRALKGSLGMVIEQSPLAIHVLTPDGFPLLNNSSWKNLCCGSQRGAYSGTPASEPPLTSIPSLWWPPRSCPRSSPYYSVPVLLRRVSALARSSDSRGSGPAPASREGGLRKTVNVIHPPPITNSNAPKTENRSGMGAVRRGAWRAKSAPAHLGSAPEPQTPKPKRMKPAE